jgi:hypothetical protein
MAHMGCPETSAGNYKSTLHNIPEKWQSRILMCVSWIQNSINIDSTWIKLSSTTQRQAGQGSFGRESQRIDFWVRQKKPGLFCKPKENCWQHCVPPFQAPTSERVQWLTDEVCSGNRKGNHLSDTWRSGKYTYALVTPTWDVQLRNLVTLPSDRIV